jgi:RNA polymerase sigma-70 factor (ECF subfamily)
MSSPDDIEDSLVVERVVAGNRELFGILVERHQRAVHSLGLGFFRNPEDASDFTQEVFLKAYRSLAGFQGRSRFSTWLYRIAYNTGINGVNRRREYASLAEDAEIPDWDSPERQLVRRCARDSVSQAVRDLPEKYRVCVDLYFFYDRSYQEIEAVTGFPVNTIKSHVFRAKKILRETLKETGEGGLG